jgi:hypothetical protein
MKIISVQNFLEKCRDITFLHDITFSRPPYDGDVIFVALFARNQIKIKSSVDKTFWDKTKSFLQYKGASVELKRAKTPVN